MEKLNKKVCNSCGESKELSDFPKDKKMNDGYKNQCRSCVNIRRRERDLENIEKVRAQNRIHDAKRRNNPERKEYSRKYANEFRKVNVTCEKCGEVYVGNKYRKTDFCPDCIKTIHCKSEEEKREARKLWYENYYQKITEKQCENCGQAFNPDYGNAKYCSDECNPWLKSEVELEKYKAALKKECGTCGNAFTANQINEVYCSSKCSKKAQNRKKELRKGKRAKRIKLNGEIDNDIALEKLIIKDDNTCHICNQLCDSNDYNITKEGHFIVGNMYPTIDHVLAIANGGTHTWDNIRLAHMACNRIKSDKLIV